MSKGGRKRDKKITLAAPHIAEQRTTDERARKALDVHIGDDKVQRIVQSPLDWCGSRGLLCPGKSRDDASMNLMMWEAGKKLQRAWHASGLSGVSAIDYTRESGSGGGGSPAWGMPANEYVATQRFLVRKAREALLEKVGSLYTGIVFSVVIDGERIEDVAPVGYSKREIKIAFGMEFLRVGLRTLAQHWGYVAASSMERC